MPQAAYRVMKFGGSSVGSPERLLRVIDLIARHHAQGPLAVVVSAMGDTTDWLIEAARLAALGQSEPAQAIAERAGELARQCLEHRARIGASAVRPLRPRRGSPNR